MKKLNVLFLSLLALVTIVSCSKDDDNSPTIEAKWQISQEGETLATLKPADLYGQCDKYVDEISGDGVLKLTKFVSVNSTCTPMTIPGTWTKQDNTITYKVAGETIAVYEIVELTESTLKVKETDEEGTWYYVYTKI